MLSTLAKFLLSLIFCISYANLNFAQESNGNCSRAQFDENLSNILGLFGVNGVNFPTNETEMDQYCRSYI